MATYSSSGPGRCFGLKAVCCIIQPHAIFFIQKKNSVKINTSRVFYIYIRLHVTSSFCPLYVSINWELPGRTEPPLLRPANYWGSLQLKYPRWCVFTPTLELQQRFISFLAFRLCRFTLLALEIFKETPLNDIIHPLWFEQSLYNQPVQHLDLLRQRAAADLVLMSVCWRLHMENGGGVNTPVRDRQTDSSPISVSTSSPSASLRLVIRLAGISRGNLIHLYRCRGKRAVMGVWWQAQ